MGVSPGLQQLLFFGTDAAAGAATTCVILIVCGALKKKIEEKACKIQSFYFTTSYIVGFIRLMKPTRYEVIYIYVLFK